MPVPCAERFDLCLVDVSGKPSALKIVPPPPLYLFHVCFRQLKRVPGTSKYQVGSIGIIRWYQVPCLMEC